MKLNKVIASAVALCATALSHAQVTLTFEGLQNFEEIREAYNGGTGSLGSSLANLGVSFSGNALAVIDSDAGGGGNISQEPSGQTALFFLSGSAATLNYAAGFTTGFSFFYSAINQPGSIVVYSGLNATGSILATLVLPLTPSGPGDPNGQFSINNQLGVAFSGTALSIDFAGTANQVAFDNITFGSTTPGGGANPVPEPSTYAMAGVLALGVIVAVRRRRQAKAPVNV